MNVIQIPTGKKVYFLSDFHLGIPNATASLQREKLILRFLDEIKREAAAILILGDLFDFWYEYKEVVPKGYVRILGKLAELTDAGIAIHFWVGNHDMWMKNYFESELQIPVYYEPTDFIINQFQFHIAHGDGLGPNDHKYKMLKKLFRNPVCQWLFGLMPPQAGIGLANYFSRKSRLATNDTEASFLGEEKEWLILYSKEILKKKKVHFFVFGHRHLPIDFRLTEESRYINLGDWISYCTYAVFDGKEMEMRSYTGKENKIVKNW